MQDFIRERSEGRGWRERSKVEAETALGLFVKIVGDRPVDTLSRRVLLEYRDALQRYPLHANGKSVYRGKDISTILQTAAARKDATISQATVNQNLTYAMLFLSRAVSCGHLQTDYSKGIKLRSKETAKKPSEPRKAYSSEDLLRLLRSPIYQPATLPRSQEERYWLPLLLLLTGARVNEAAQLYLCDIREVDGVPPDGPVLCLDFNEDEEDKRLKNPTSARLTPIPRALLELGFMDFVEGSRRKGRTRLFENLKKMRNGYGHSFSRWWGRYGREHVSKDSKKTLHSLRAGFITTLLNSGVELATVRALVGHSAGGGRRKVDTSRDTPSPR